MHQHSDLCGPCTERPRWVIPAAVHFLSMRMNTSWLSKPLSTICSIWSLLSPSFLESSIESSRFTSLCLLLLCYWALNRMTTMRLGRLPLLHTNISHLYQAHCVLPHIHVNSHYSNVLKAASCSQHTEYVCLQFSTIFSIAVTFLVFIASLSILLLKWL